MKEFNKSNVNYQVLFILGITFTGAGVAMQFYPLMIIGLLFMGIGLFNRAKWSQNNEQHKK